MSAVVQAVVCRSLSLQVGSPLIRPVIDLSHSGDVILPHDGEKLSMPKCINSQMPSNVTNPVEQVLQDFWREMATRAKRHSLQILHGCYILALAGGTGGIGDWSPGSLEDHQRTRTAYSYHITPTRVTRQSSTMSNRPAETEGRPPSTGNHSGQIFAGDGGKLIVQSHGDGGSGAGDGRCMSKPIVTKL